MGIFQNLTNSCIQSIGHFMLLHRVGLENIKTGSTADVFIIRHEEREETYLALGYPACEIFSPYQAKWKVTQAWHAVQKRSSAVGSSSGCSLNALFNLASPRLWITFTLFASLPMISAVSFTVKSSRKR